MRKEILEIRKVRSHSSAKKDARDIIETKRHHRQDKRSRGGDKRDSSASTTASSRDSSSSHSRSRSRHRKHSRRSGESTDRDRSRSSQRSKGRLSKYGYNLPRPHHVVKPDALRGKHKKAKPEDLAPIEHIYGNVETAHRSARKVDGKYAPALQELLEYTGYQVRNFHGYKDEAVLLLDDEFRQQAKRDRLSLSDQPARDRLSHFHLNPQDVRNRASGPAFRLARNTRYNPTLVSSNNQICYKYNNDRCFRPNCTYTHACSSCGDSKHKATNCPKSTCSAGSTGGPK